MVSPAARYGWWLRPLALSILAFACALSATGARGEAFEVTDMAGRKVMLHDRPARIVLADGHLLTAFALLDPKPAEKIAGWSDDLARFDPGTYAQYLHRFPEIARIPILGPAAAGSLSAEALLALGPDLVIMPRWSTDTALEDQLSAAGIALIYVDFFEDPLRDTAPMMRVLGRVLGREQQAEAYVSFYEAHLQRVARALARVAPVRPRIFLHGRAGGWDCCWTVGGSLGRLIEFAGGRNIAAEAVRGSTGQIGLEAVLASSPEVYIAAGGPALPGVGGFAIGPGTSPEMAAEGVRLAHADPFLRTLPALTTGRAHALWLFFFRSPVNLVAIEVMAKWFHPALFADLDPRQTLTEINRRFLSVPMEGAYWTQYEPSRP